VTAGVSHSFSWVDEAADGHEAGVHPAGKALAWGLVLLVAQQLQLLLQLLEMSAEQVLIVVLVLVVQWVQHWVLWVLVLLGAVLRLPAPLTAPCCAGYWSTHAAGVTK
jgi:hypothetical protein